MTGRRQSRRFTMSLPPEQQITNFLKENPLGADFKFEFMFYFTRALGYPQNSLFDPGGRHRENGAYFGVEFEYKCFKAR